MVNDPTLRLNYQLSVARAVEQVSVILRRMKSPVQVEPGWIGLAVLLEDLPRD